MSNTLLGGLAPRTFLSRYWQRRPFLVRGAMPQFAEPVDLAGLKRLAARDDIESRIVRRVRTRWHLAHGPFSRQAFARLPARNWTLLAQGLNHAVPAAERLLARFAFVPWARVDDVMVSYAVAGGGVGPHVDSYDVFLLQGRGRRRWRISAQRDLPLDPRAPVNIVTGFRAEQEWVLEAGDMLYLPPGVVHEGVALDPCTTYSIGFRAPRAEELGREFLGWLQERLVLPGVYRDPGRIPATHPGRLPEDMVDAVAAMLERIRWTREDAAAFLGTYLSDPKAHVLFEPPARPVGRRAFAQRVARAGIRLAPATLLLVRKDACFINGEAVRVSAPARPAVARLADARFLIPGAPLPGPAADLLYTWYEAGYALIGGHHE